MTTTPEPLKKVPRIEGNPAPALRADHNALADWVRDKTGEAVPTVEDLPLVDNWEGRHIYVAEDQCDYIWSTDAWHDTSGIAVFGTPTPGNGWEATPGSGHTPRLRRRGDQTFAYGAITAGSGAGGGSLLIIPTPFRPPNSNTRFVGTNVCSAGVSISYLMAGGTVSISAAYATGSGTTTSGVTHPIWLHWWMD